MRNISFMLTKEQFLNRTKTVTRRHGWKNLVPGQVLMGVEKSQGLKKGEKIRPLGAIRVISARREPLSRMRELPYGLEEVRKEGFEGKYTPGEFVTFFCQSHRGCTPDTEITRIEFEHIDGQRLDC